MKERVEYWREWERQARITGWDFSRIEAYYTQEKEPWDYRQEILSRLTPQMDLLDIDTGGGEFLLALQHPAGKTAVTEAYPPNAELCRRSLAPLGIRVEEVRGDGALPFADACFDMVTDRHGDFNAEEFFRVLRPGGYCITQQVGAYNDREFRELLCPQSDLPFPTQTLPRIREQFQKAGFTILAAQEAYPELVFTDVGALVWFARVIEWEFPGFTVDSALPNLLRAQEILERDGAIAAHTHRILVVAKKMEGLRLTVQMNTE